METIATALEEAEPGSYKRIEDSYYNMIDKLTECLKFIKEICKNQDCCENCPVCEILNCSCRDIYPEDYDMKRVDNYGE